MVRIKVRINIQVLFSFPLNDKDKIIDRNKPQTKHILTPINDNKDSLLKPDLTS